MRNFESMRLSANRCTAKTAIDFLRKNAKKQFIEAKARNDIDQAVDNYCKLDEWGEIRNEREKPGVVRQELFKEDKIFNAIDRLIKLYNLLKEEENFRTFVHFAAAEYEELPEATEELKERHKNEAKDHDGLDPDHLYLSRMEDLVAMEINEMLQVLNKAKRRMRHVQKCSTKRKRDWQITARDNLIRKLAQIYMTHTGTDRAAPSRYVSRDTSYDTELGGPFVDFVRAIWQDFDLPPFFGSPENIVANAIYAPSSKSKKSK